MKVLGISFAPLNTSLEKRLQTLSVGLHHLFIAFGPLVGITLVAYVLLCTKFWYLSIFYLIWIWKIDTEICETGGRRIQYIRDLNWWNYFKNYFPTRFVKDSLETKLDPKRNYLFCSFPHGVIATGIFSTFGTTCGGFADFFPDHTSYIMTLKQNFFMPLFREYILSLGGVAASAKSINYLMGSPKGGNAALLVVGGAAEAFYAKPGQYKLVLKNRKGFVKLALRNGCSLVPVFSFGETNIYDQVDNPKGSLLRGFQEWMKAKTGIAPILPLGRGFLQYSFGIVPHRKPINVVVGQPIDVEAVENPTQEQIDSLHDTFINNLTELFERHKQKYVEDPDNTILMLEPITCFLFMLSSNMSFKKGFQRTPFITGFAMSGCVSVALIFFKTNPTFRQSFKK